MKYIGNEKLIELNEAQILKFEQYTKNKEWNKFHHTHYDWWAYPINEPSRFGEMYQLKQENIDELYKN